MRIISGKKKGCKLTGFSGDGIRPTTDRVKESVFNLIQEYISDADVLDLFAGSGALCFEAISRGAKSGICIDISPDSVGVIKKNCDKLGFSDLVSIKNTDAESFLKCTSAGFDIIFMDPPYNKGFIAPIMDIIAERGVLNDGGIIVTESDGIDELPSFEGFCMLKNRRYGRTVIGVYAKIS